MKSYFSPSWLSSSLPRKQRKYIANSPLHRKHKFLSANLSKALREKYGKRNLPLRTGDEVLVMRGSFKKKKAKITEIDLKRTRVILENIQRQKKDGGKVAVFFHPSVLQIQTLIAEDKNRISAINKKATQKTIKPVKESDSKHKGQKNVSN